MTDLFDHYRGFMENVERSMDCIIGSRSRGAEIRDSDAFRKFWYGVCSRPGMRCQWERRLAGDGYGRERDAILKIVSRLVPERSKSDDREAA